jgi:HK97 family phage major capsid protein
MDLQPVEELRSVDDLVAQQTEVRGAIKDMHEKNGVDPLDDSEQEEWAKLKSRDEELTRRVDEFRARERYVRTIAENPANVEREVESEIPRGTTREQSIYDISRIRIDPFHPENARQDFHDRAMRAVETATYPGANKERSADDIRGDLEQLLDKDTPDGYLARRILVTGAPAYRRAFAKIMSGQPVFSLPSEEQKAVERAFTLGSTGLPVTFTLDPTVIKVSSGVINPWRSLASVEQTVVNEWRGVTAAAVVAAYAAEAAEASDNTPTLAQPAIVAARAQAFIPFSIETQQDWGSLESQMGSLFADAKDVLESAKFFSGGGTNEPFGINAATTAIDVATISAGAYVIGDVYPFMDALPPRWQANASVVCHPGYITRTRQFDTAGGAGLLIRIGEGTGRNRPNSGLELNGYPLWKSTQMLNVLTTGTRALLIGDFSMYKIIDRVGMNVELLPHLVTTNHRPTGQRGLYAYWRNGGKLIDETAFRFLKT